MNCLRGASAVQTVLQQHRDAPLRIFAIWQPMLASDLAPPITWALGRLPDTRVRQYWDPDRVLAQQLAADARPPQPEPDCCDWGGILWDLVAVYPPGALWEDRMPPAAFFNGPISDVAEDLGTAIGRLAPKSVSLVVQ